MIFLVIFLIKLLSAYCLYQLTIENNPELVSGKISLLGGDTFSYIGSMENYIQTGEYFFLSQHPILKTKIYSGRMPYYGVTYYVFRLFFDKSTSTDLMVLSQIFLESLSILFLALLVLKITQKYLLFVLALTLMAISLNITSWSCYLLTDSFSVSFLIFFIYAYYLYLENHSQKYLFYSGIFLGSLCLLKPYFAPLYLLVGLEFIFYDKKIKAIILKSLYVSFPLILALSPWVIRNYAVHKKVILFQENTTGGYWLSESHHAMNDFIKCWGGSTVFWEVKSPSYYFLKNDKYTEQYKFPSHAFTEAYDMKDLMILKNRMQKLYQKYNEAEDRNIAQEFDKLSDNYQEKRPLDYYIISPIRRMKDMIFHIISLLAKT